MKARRSFRAAQLYSIHPTHQAEHSPIMNLCSRHDLRTTIASQIINTCEDRFVSTRSYCLEVTQPLLICHACSSFYAYRHTGRQDLDVCLIPTSPSLSMQHKAEKLSMHTSVGSSSTSCTCSSPSAFSHFPLSSSLKELEYIKFVFMLVSSSSKYGISRHAMG